MSRWLTCSICRQRKVVGIMSAQSWESVSGSSHAVYACPDCQAKHADWREQLARAADESG